MGGKDESSAEEDSDDDDDPEQGTSGTYHALGQKRQRPTVTTPRAGRKTYHRVAKRRRIIPLQTRSSTPGRSPCAADSPRLDSPVLARPDTPSVFSFRSESPVSDMPFVLPSPVSFRSESRFC